MSKKEDSQCKSGKVCILCGETIETYVVGIKDGIYQYPNPQFEEVEHENMKDCIIQLCMKIKDLEQEVGYLNSKID